MKQKLILPLSLLLVFGLATTVSAHGAKIEYTLHTTVEIRAAYDNGEPMGGAQVTVYAPNDPSTPWFSDVCDQQGRFTFTPDPAIPGTWDVQARQAGHGDIIHISIGEDGATSGSTGYTTLQTVLMGACVIWGLVGTALFFSRKPAHAQRTGESDAHS